MTGEQLLQKVQAWPLSRRLDPRLYQIGVLAGLLIYGISQLKFDVRPGHAAVMLSTVLLTQYACTRLWKLPAYDPKSALISGLSLCLLLRTNMILLAVITAVITIASKFVLRVKGKHIFNPTNLGVVAMLLATGGQVWVSPGQWGSAATFGFLMACLGGLVVNRARRSDVTYAFIVFYGALLLSRSLWLGEPMAIPLHRVENGALLLFTFFMISDPKTTPDSRAGRILFAFLVAFGAAYVQFRLFRTNGLLWSLAFFSPVVPLIDRWLPGARYDWKRASRPLVFPKKELIMNRASILPAIVLGVGMLGISTEAALGFCGFYVAKADTKLYNKASQVVLVRNENRTVLTMANDFKGDPKEFAIVVPVPTFLEREQIHIGDKAILDHLDAYSAPRLVEYFDGDPCRQYVAYKSPAGALNLSRSEADAVREKSLGITVEARYTVGEYDIVILSAKQSNGLETWLTENGYRIPQGASKVLAGYIKQKMRFFVAKVNLEKQANLGFSYLRPIQIAFESPKFMLPIRLGMVNADGPQELFVYALTRSGRVETTNYRTVKLPTGMELPVYVKEEFSDFYRAMFTEQVEKESMRAVFLEYAWDMNWCDPCAADPLSTEELRQLGVFWLDQSQDPTTRFRPPPGGAQEVFVTRLHLRYDEEHFPQDLVFQETGDRENYQGRYVLRHPWKGGSDCPGAREYRQEVRRRQEEEAKTLAALTGWPVAEIRQRIGIDDVGADPVDDDPSWWEKLWGKGEG
jgi:Na+-translocating ferredoxin:NAD+ oxidoreductase RnfD subunit